MPARATRGSVVRSHRRRDASIGTRWRTRRRAYPPERGVRGRPRPLRFGHIQASISGLTSASRRDFPSAAAPRRPPTPRCTVPLAPVSPVRARAAIPPPTPPPPPRSLRRVPSPSPRTTLPRAPSARGTPCAPPSVKSADDDRAEDIPEWAWLPATPRCSPSPTPRCAAPTSRPPSIAPRRANPASPSPCVLGDARDPGRLLETRHRCRLHGNPNTTPNPNDPTNDPTDANASTPAGMYAATIKDSTTRARLKSERAPSGFDSARRLGPERASAPSSASSSLASSPRASVGSDAGHRAFSFDTPESGLPPLAPRTPGFGSREASGARQARPARGSGARGTVSDGTSPVVGTPAVGVGTPAVGTPTAAAPASRVRRRGRARGGFDIHCKYLQGASQIPSRAASNVVAGERRRRSSVARGASTTGGADGARWTARANRRPPRRNPPAETIAVPRGGIRGALARWRRSSASLAPNLVDSAVVISASFVRVETPRWRSSSCDSRSPRASPSRPRLRETRDDSPRERRDGRVVRGGGGYRRGVAGIDRGRHLRGVGRVAGDERDGRRAHEQPTPSKFRAETRKRTPPRVRDVASERRSPRATRDASPRRRSFDRIVGDARARRSRRAARFERGVFSRGPEAAGRRSWRRSRRRVGVERRLLEVAPKAAERRDDRKTTARAVRVVSRACTSRAFARVAASRASANPAARCGFGRYKCRGGDDWRRRDRFERGASARGFSPTRACAPSRFRTRLQTRAAPTRVARVFALASVDDVGKSSENRRAATAAPSTVRASPPRRARRAVGARYRRARGASEATTHAPDARRFESFGAARFVFLGVAIFSAYDRRLRRGRRFDLDAECSRREGSKIWSMFQKTRRAHAQLRAMTRWKRYVTRRAIGKSTCARRCDRVFLSSASVAACSRDGRGWRRTNLRRGHVSREMRPRGARRSGMATRRVVLRAWRASARDERRAPRVVADRSAVRGGIFRRAFRASPRGDTRRRRRPSRDDAWKRWRFGASWTPPRTRSRGGARVRARLRDGAATRATRDGRIDSAEKTAAAFFEWARAAAGSAARRARDAADHLAADAARGANARLETIRVAREARLVGRVTLRLRRGAFDAYADVVRRDRGASVRAVQTPQAMEPKKRHARVRRVEIHDARRQTTGGGVPNRRATVARLEIARAFAAWVEIADDARRDEARARVAAKWFVRIASRRDRTTRESVFHEWRTLARASRRVLRLARRAASRMALARTRGAFDRWTWFVGDGRAWRRRARKADRLMRRVLGRAHLDAFASWVDAFGTDNRSRRFLEVAKLRRRRNRVVDAVAKWRRATRDARLIKTLGDFASMRARSRRTLRAFGAWRVAMADAIFGARLAKLWTARARFVRARGCFSAWRLRADRRTRLLDVAERRVAHVVASATFRAWRKMHRENKTARRGEAVAAHAMARFRDRVCAPPSTRGSKTRGRRSGIVERSKRCSVGGVSVGSGARFRGGSKRWRRRRGRDDWWRRRSLARPDAPPPRRSIGGSTRSKTQRDDDASRRGRGDSPRGFETETEPSRSGVGRRHQAVQEGAPRGGEDRREMVALALAEAFTCWAHRVEDLRRERRVVEKIAARWSRLALAEAFTCWAHRVEDLRRERRVVEKIAARWSRLALAEAFTCWAHRVEDLRRGAPRGGEDRREMVAFGARRSLHVLGSSRRGSAEGAPRGGEDRREVVAFGARRSLRVLGSSRRGSAEGAPRGGEDRREMVAFGARGSLHVLGSSRRGSAEGAPRGGEDRREMVAFGARRSLRMLAQDAPRKQDGASRGSCRRARHGEVPRSRVRRRLRRVARKREDVARASSSARKDARSVASQSGRERVSEVDRSGGGGGAVETIGGEGARSRVRTRRRRGVPSVDRRARRRRETTTRRGAGAAIRREASKPRRSRRVQGVGRRHQAVQERAPRGGEDRREMVAFGARRGLRMLVPSRRDVPKRTTGRGQDRASLESPSSRERVRLLVHRRGVTSPRTRLCDSRGVGDGSPLASRLFSPLRGVVSRATPRRSRASSRRGYARASLRPNPRAIFRRLDGRGGGSCASSPRGVSSLASTSSRVVSVFFSRWRDFVDEERRVKKLFAKCARRVAVGARRRRSIVGGKSTRAPRADATRDARRRFAPIARASSRPSSRLASDGGSFGARFRDGANAPRHTSANEERSLKSPRDGRVSRRCARSTIGARGSRRARVRERVVVARARRGETRDDSRDVAAMARLRPRGQNFRRSRKDASSIRGGDGETRARCRFPRMARRGGGSTKARVASRANRRVAVDASDCFGRVRDVGRRRRGVSEDSKGDAKDVSRGGGVGV